MRITYMGLIEETILRYHCSEKEAKEACEKEAMETLTWEQDTEGVHNARDSFGNPFFVIQYQAA